MSGATTREAQAPISARPCILLGLAVLVISFGGLGAWAAMAPIASAVVAPGVVMVNGSRKRVQHPQGGTVARIHVRDGDIVTRGQVLLDMDATQARASLGIVRARLQAARALKARLQAERDGSDVIHFPDDLLERVAEEPAIRGLLDGQRSLHEARGSTLDSEVAILGSRIEQLEDDIGGLEMQARSKRRQMALIAEELASYETLLDQGYVDKPRLLALEREAARLDGERGESASEIARARTRIGETRLQIIQRRQGFREQVVSELRDTEAEIADLSERLASASHVVDHVEVRAPRDGIVVGLQVHTEGGVVGAGDTLMEIVPAGDRLVIEARVAPDDIDAVRPGLSTDVRFTAFSWRSSALVVGEVDYVSADRLIDPRTAEPYYLVRVAVPEHASRAVEGTTIVPGMAAEIMIRAGERTALEYLSQPLVDTVRRAWREQ